MNDALAQLDDIASELVAKFGVVTAPVPVETMVQNPVDGLWEVVDLTRLSGTFMTMKHRYSPRMSMARMLARHVVGSDWGAERNLPGLINHDEERMQEFARMLIMPLEIIKHMDPAGRNPTTMSLQFEVPEEDARLRLQYLFG